MFGYPGDSGTGTMVPGAPFGPWVNPHPYPSPTGPVILPTQPPPVQPVAPQPPPVEPVQPTPPQDPMNRYVDGGFMVDQSTTAHVDCTVNNDGSSSCTVGISSTW